MAHTRFARNGQESQMESEEQNLCAVKLSLQVLWKKFGKKYNNDKL